MSNEKNEFIPEITINNTGTIKMADIDGVKQKVEVRAQEGFNIKIKKADGSYDKSFFLKDLEGVILFDRYQIQSKYSQSPMYFSNEFEFSGDRNRLRVYSPEDSKVLYEGDYNGAKEAFATGKMTGAGTPEKTFDVYSILYVLIEGEVFRFRWKMNQNNNWFGYKDGCKVDKSSRGDNKDYRGVNTKFSLDTKKFGTNEFWACTLQNISENDRGDADRIGDELEDKLDKIEASYNSTETISSGNTNVEDEINVENVPF